MIKKIAYFIIGLLCMALGIVLLIKAEFGLSAFDGLCRGLSDITVFTTGNWNMALGIVIIFINAIIARKRPDIFSFLTSILVGLFIDFWMILLDMAAMGLPVRLAVFTIGILLNTFGVALYISAELANGPIDQLMLNISNLLHKNISWGKTIMESVFLILVLLIHGPFGIGTIVVTFTSGFLVNCFYDKLRGRKTWKTVKNI